MTPQPQVQENERARLPDRCTDCGRFVGFYPVGFYDDRYCRDCFDNREDTRKARAWAASWHELCARRGY